MHARLARAFSYSMTTQLEGQPVYLTQWALGNALCQARRSGVLHLSAADSSQMQGHGERHLCTYIDNRML